MIKFVTLVEIVIRRLIFYFEVIKYVCGCNKNLV